MKPQRVIERREPSEVARCERPGCACGNVALVLIVTRSPVPEWDWLVLERCVGAIHVFQGVEDEQTVGLG